MKVPILFRWALLLLPAAFRRRHGGEILEVARRRADDLPTEPARLRFWGRESLDLLRTSLRLRLGAATLGPTPTSLPPAARRARRPLEVADMLESFAHHLKLAVRQLIRRPAFSALVVLLLAIGIGANTAMFSLFHGVLLEPLPFTEPERLVRLWGSWSAGDFARISPPDFLDYQQHNEVFTSLAASTSFQPRFAITGHGEPERVVAALVTANFFDTLGVLPVLGRGFGAGESAAGGEAAVVLSHGYWQRRFGGDPEIVGSSLQVDGEAHRVLGVMPPAFSYPAGSELWRPIPHQTMHQAERRFHFLNPVGRMRPEVTLAEVDENLNLIAAQLEQAYPESNTSWRVRPVPLRQVLVGGVRSPLQLLFAAVGLLLLIACGDVAILLVARALARQREMAVRCALGAGRGQIFSQLLTESALLAGVGGAAGVGLAWAALGAVRRLGPGLPRLDELSLSAPVLLFALVLSMVTGVLFGLAPALHALRLDLAQRLKTGGRMPSGRGLRLRGLLVVAQMALSVLLLIGAGLLLRSFGRLLEVDPGFDPRGTLTASIELPVAGYPERDDSRLFFDRLLAEARSLPGVASVGATNQLPMVGGGDTYVHPAGQPPATPAERRTAQIRKATPDYFETMAITVAAGRGFTAADRAGTPPAVVINRALVRRDFAAQRPREVLGRRLVIDLGEPVEATIVGVVDDVLEFGPGAPPPEIFYLAASQYPSAAMQLVLRTGGDPAALAGPLRALVHELDPNLPLSGMASLHDLLQDSVAQPRFRAVLLGFFAAVALLLAAVGLYGVLSNFVGQRTHEVGVRVALGADRRAVLGLVLGRGLGLAASGILLGLAAASFATKLLSGLLFGVEALDPWTFAAMPGLLILVALVACILPARRASRIDPVVAFRAE